MTGLIAAAEIPEIVAHRGASFDAPENSRASIQLAWQQHADVAEFDVHLTKDGRIVLLHDETLLRTAGLDRAIRDLTEAEAVAMDIGRWMDERFIGEKLPTLAEILTTVPRGRRVFIEVKCGPEIVPELDRVLRASGLAPQQTAVIAFDAEVIAAMKRQRVEIPAYWVVSLKPKKCEAIPQAADLITTARRIGADGLDLSATPEVLTPEFAAAIKQAGLPFYVWTVNDVCLARRMIALGASGITTDRPQWLRERLAEDPALLRVMTYNIRFANAHDGANRWELRRDRLVKTIQRFDPDLLGAQEVLAAQRDDLVERLPRHAVFAAGRDDGRDAGEMCAIFYRRDRFRWIDGGHFWLSEQPEQPGRPGWDAALPRMATWVKLSDEHNPASKRLIVLNTHLDHRGAQARIESMKLLKRKLAELADGCRVVVLGDFNAGEGSPEYAELFRDAEGNQLRLRDAFREANPHRTEVEGTFGGFRTEPVRGPRIDWIATSSDWQCGWAMIDRSGTGGAAPSDHFPVAAVLAPVDVARPRLRVLCYNIRHGRGLDDQVNLERIAQIIQDARPDLVALQEVDRLTRRSGQVDQTAVLAKLTNLEGRFGKAIDYDGGEYGQAILSRYPILTTTTYQLPGKPDREQRIAFAAECTIGDHRLVFATTHLHHLNAQFREEQAAELAARLGSLRHAVLLAGDFNTPSDSTPMRPFATDWRIIPRDPRAYTFPAGQPRKQIDLILLKPATHFRIVEERVIADEVASDHRPVLADVEWLIPPKVTR